MSELEAALEAWLDAGSGDEATNERLADAVSSAIVEPEHWIMAIKPGGYLLKRVGAPLRTGYRVRCRCRWRSAWYPTPTAARNAGRDHVRESDGGG